MRSALEVSTLAEGCRDTRVAWTGTLGRSVSVR
jgi:hypothetical protein